MSTCTRYVGSLLWLCGIKFNLNFGSTYERASKTENFSTGQKISENDTTTDTTFLGNARKPYVYLNRH